MISYFRTHRCIYIGKITLNIFMEFNPPCTNCLVRGMCLFIYDSNPPPSAFQAKSWNLRTKSCNILYEFLINNEGFGRSEY